MSKLDIKLAQDAFKNDVKKKKNLKKSEYDLIQSMKTYDSRIKKNIERKTQLRREEYQLHHSKNIQWERKVKDLHDQDTL